MCQNKQQNDYSNLQNEMGIVVPRNSGIAGKASLVGTLALRGIRAAAEVVRMQGETALNVINIMQGRAIDAISAGKARLSNIDGVYMQNVASNARAGVERVASNAAPVVANVGRGVAGGVVAVGKGSAKVAKTAARHPKITGATVCAVIGLGLAGYVALKNTQARKAEASEQDCDQDGRCDS